MSKKGVKADTTPKGVAKRVKWLKGFLDELVKEKQFRSTEAVFAILSMGKEDFAKTRKEALKELKSIAELPHFNGKANIGITNAKISLSHTIGKYISENITLYDKLKATNDEIAKIMERLSVTLAKQAEIYKELSISSTNIEVNSYYYFLYRVVCGNRTYPKYYEIVDRQSKRVYKGTSRAGKRAVIQIFQKSKRPFIVTQRGLVCFQKTHDS